MGAVARGRGLRLGFQHQSSFPAWTLVARVQQQLEGPRPQSARDRSLVSEQLEGPSRAFLQHKACKIFLGGLKDGLLIDLPSSQGLCDRHLKRPPIKEAIRTSMG